MADAAFPRLVRRVLVLACVLLILLPAASAADTLSLGDAVVMRAAAVADTGNGFVGSTATITIRTADNGSGHIFLDTFPLTAVDMQGSARLAARVASQVTGVALASHDFFFTIRSASEQIGGPSAGADMTVGTIAALNGWKVRPDVLMTGTIEPDGSVGPVGGIPEKAAAAAQAGVTTFLFPAGEEITTLSSTGKDVNLTQYCATQLHIACIPTSDVIQAVNVMTDHQIVLPPLSGNVTGEAFLARLAPLSAQLVDASGDLIQQARDAGVTPAASCAPNANGGLDLAPATRLACAIQTEDAARAAAGNATYYTAASLSFQAAIDAHDARDAARFQADNATRASLADRLAASAATVDAARQLIEPYKVDTVGVFETAGAAQVRLLEAEGRIAEAQATARNATSANAALLAIYQAAYAAERANTATWWLKLGEGGEPGHALDAQGLADLARDEITASREEIAYVTAVFSQANVQASVAEASRLLDDAQNAYDRGLYAGAMLDALDAEVSASVLLESAGFRGSVPQEKLAAAQAGAARAIEQARARGVEPFLAESEYEFGQTQQDPVTALTFYGQAKVSANLAGLPGAFGNAPVSADSRFQGFPQVYAPPQWIVGAFAVGMALGAGLGLIALLPRREDVEHLERVDSGHAVGLAPLPPVEPPSPPPEMLSPPPEGGMP
ncbi:MAG: uncharacterized protein QOE90_379 [Thermoplasmata archaeon]|jgi:uncharacterized protein|nr:uncharacterized protein [Thermoplasmata archaeon]